MANVLTPLSLVNQAYRNLGELPIASFTDSTNPRSLLAAQFYATVQEDLFADGFWNFATVRVTLLPYLEPAGDLVPAATTGTGILFTASITGVFGLNAVGKRLVGNGVAGDATVAALVTSSPAATCTPAAGALVPAQTGVIFTAGAAAFGAGDVGKLLENLGGVGVARITGFTDTTHVTATIVTAWEAVTPMLSGAWRLVRTDQVTANITSAFASTATIPAGSWRLWNAAPAWGFSYAMDIPADYVRVQRIGDSRIYQREGDQFVTNEPTLPLTYTQLVTDVTRYPPSFVSAFVAQLTAEFAGQIADLTPKRDLWLKVAATRLRRAKKDDGQEGSAPQLTASSLVTARLGGWNAWPKRLYPY